MPPETSTRTTTLTGTSELTAGLGPRCVLMRARYDKGREPTMAAMDGLAKTPRRSHASEADTPAQGSATPVDRTERCSTSYTPSPDEPRSDARDDAYRSGLTAPNDASFGKEDPTATRVACARAAMTTTRADNVCRTQDTGACEMGPNEPVNRRARRWRSPALARPS